MDDVKDLLNRPNFHCVKLEAPIDSYESERMMAYGLSSDGSNFQKNVSELAAGGKKEKIVSKKLKILELKNESYLEDFVKTMV